LREILRVATGPVVVLAEELADIEGIESAFVYGSFAARVQGEPGPAPHDIDLVVVGQPDVDAVYEACTRVERRSTARSTRRSSPINVPADLARATSFLRQRRGLGVA